jgi:hypothetical protein
MITAILTTALFTGSLAATILGTRTIAGDPVQTGPQTYRIPLSDGTDVVCFGTGCDVWISPGRGK